MQIVEQRNTKYVDAVKDALERLGHATNNEIIAEIRKNYPEVSATTIHRVTSRLLERGVIARAPKCADGSERFDIRTERHHHFMCSQCDRLCDVDNSTQAKQAMATLKALVEDCKIAGTVTMTGICNNCEGEI